MKITVRIKAAGLRKKVAALTPVLAEESQRALLQLAGEAIDLIEGADPAERRRYVVKALERQFQWVFIPVILKRVRREQWPDLEMIYRARILRGQRTYRGRKRFHVDHAKEDALFERLLARALARRTTSVYEVRLVPTSDRRWRVEIVKTRGGKVSARDQAVMIAFAKQRMRVVASDTLARAFTRAGLLEGRSRGGRASWERDDLEEQLAASSGAPLL